MASDGQAFMHGASSQCMHSIGTKLSSSALGRCTTWVRLRNVPSGTACSVLHETAQA